VAGAGPWRARVVAGAGRGGRGSWRARSPTASVLAWCGGLGYGSRVRIESAILVKASETVGPTRLRMLTAGSAKLPVVVLAGLDGQPAYFVFDVAALQAELSDKLSATPISEVLDAGAARAAVTHTDATDSDIGAPVIENGRLLGVVAADIPERPEPGEEDLARGASTSSEPAGSHKRGLWSRLSRSHG
jgi:hypothetical protein